MSRAYGVRHSLQLAAAWAASWAVCVAAGYGIMVLLIPGGAR